MIQLCNVSSDDESSRWRVILHKLRTCLLHHKIFTLHYWDWYFDSKVDKVLHIQALNNTPILTKLGANNIDPLSVLDVIQSIKLNQNCYPTKAGHTTKCRRLRS